MINMQHINNCKRSEKITFNIVNMCDTVGRTDCFWNAGLRLFSQNVVVSKSRHRLLFYPTRKGQKHRKIPFRYFSRVREVDYRKGRC